MSLFELLTGRTMSVSINPIGHDRMMNDQLAEFSIGGLDPKITADLRAVVRRMCAYDRDYRPTALEAADELEQVYYAVPREERITLPEFAKGTVLPIYEGRSRKRPSEALDSLQDAEFLGKLTGDPSTGRSSADLGRRMRSPAGLFALGLSTVIVLLGLMVAMKMGRSEARDPAPAPPAPGRVQVKVWIPSDAHATIGSQFIDAAGVLWLDPGQTEMWIDFSDGRHLRCGFAAVAGAEVRYVVDNGAPALSVNDAASVPCSPAVGPGG
jgi:hypothetical protein